MRVLAEQVVPTVRPTVGMSQDTQGIIPVSMDIIGNDMDDWEAIYSQCQQEAIEAGALKPQGLMENIAAGTMSYNGQSFANTAVAQQRLKAWTLEIIRRKGYSLS